MKKVVSICLALVLMFSVLPFGAFELSVNAEKEGNYTYSVENGEATIKETFRYMSGAITIPSTLGGYPVAHIGERAFWQLDSVTSITIPNTVKTIGESAFYNCKKLTSIIIPNGVTSIGAYAFLGCEKITSISLPDSLTSIGEEAFGSTAYYKDSNNWLRHKIDSQNYIDSVLYIDNHLIAVNKSFSINVYEIKSGTLTIADNAFYKCHSVKEVNIPESVVSIGSRAFYECIALKRINFSSNITQIKDETFYNSGLEYVIIPEGVTAIGERAFYSCDVLTSITLPDSVISIGEEAFYDTEYYTNSDNWTSKVLYIDNHLIKAQDALAGSYTVKNGTLSIADGAFSDCSHNFVMITIPNSVISVGCNALNCVSLTTVKIGKGVKRIGRGAFEGCHYIEEVYITDINAWCNIVFEDSGSNPMSYLDGTANVYLNGKLLTDLVIPNGITKINDYAFYNWTNIKSVTIPKSVKSIGYLAFYYCESVEDVYFLGTKNEWEKINIDDTSIPFSQANIHYLLPGDIDGDESINLNDLVTIAQYTAGWGNLEINQYALDVNGDGVVNLQDVTHFAQYLAGWEGIVLH